MRSTMLGFYLSIALVVTCAACATAHNDYAAPFGVLVGLYSAFAAIDVVRDAERA